MDTILSAIMRRLPGDRANADNDVTDADNDLDDPDGDLVDAAGDLVDAAGDLDDAAGVEDVSDELEDEPVRNRAFPAGDGAEASVRHEDTAGDVASAFLGETSPAAGVADAGAGVAVSCGLGDLPVSAEGLASIGEDSPCGIHDVT